MEDPFKRTLLTIITNLPSLCQFIQASTAAAKIYKDCPSEIVEAIISRLPEQLPNEIRAVARALPRISSNDNIDDLLANFGTSLKLDDKNQDPLPRDFPLSSIETLVNMAHQIHYVVASFLST